MQFHWPSELHAVLVEKVPPTFGIGRAEVPGLSDSLGIAKAGELLVGPGALEIMGVLLLLDGLGCLLVGVTVVELLLLKLSLLARGCLIEPYLLIGKANFPVLND